MMEDERDRMRKEAILNIQLTEKTLHYVIKKTLDISHKVRQAVYKSLLAKRVKFDSLNHDDRLSIIINGLKDIESEVRLTCKEYLASSICARTGEVPDIVKGDNMESFAIGNKLNRKY
jgi:hypothetical protein